MKIYPSMTDLIGHTPLIELKRLAEATGVQGRLLVKLESVNPAGSIKDRAAAMMIDDALANGRLKPGGTIIEPTSGNTGIALAAIAAARGFHAVIVMPDSMSRERRQLMLAYGAELVLTPGAAGMQGAIDKANDLQRARPGSMILGQFTNPANPRAHYLSTGPEIWDDTDGTVDVLVAGIGTGGTISGTGRYLKKQNRHIRVIGVEPDSSAVISGEERGPHLLQGIGAGFIPDNLDQSVLDEIIKVSGKAAYNAVRLCAMKEGLLIGISGGAALSAALDVASLPGMSGKTVVAILPDGGDRYLSTPDLFKSE